MLLWAWLQTTRSGKQWASVTFASSTCFRHTSLYPPASHWIALFHPCVGAAEACKLGIPGKSSSHLPQVRVIVTQSIFDANSQHLTSAGRPIFSRSLTACTAQPAHVAQPTEVRTLQDQPSTSGRANETPLPAHQGLSETQLQRNKVLISRLQGKLILAPLTKYACQQDA